MFARSKAGNFRVDLNPVCDLSEHDGTANLVVLCGVEHGDGLQRDQRFLFRRLRLRDDRRERQKDQCNYRDWKRLHTKYFVASRYSSCMTFVYSTSTLVHRRINSIPSWAMPASSSRSMPISRATKFVLRLDKLSSKRVAKAEHPKK